MTNWEIEPYVALSTIKAASKCNKKTMIKFPQFLGRTSTINKNKRMKMNIDDYKLFEDKSKTKSKVNKTKETNDKKETKEKKPRGRPKK
jgi:hypothetical protein